MKCIVIDDVEDMRILIGDIVQSFGYTAIFAGNGEEGCAMIREHADATFALVDWDMPVLSGLDLIKRVRENAAYDEMKLIVVTGYNDMDDVAEALFAGADEYLMKPFTQEMLADKLAILGLECTT